MKILLINSLYSPYFVGGAERSVQALAEGLIGLGNEVAVVSTADQEADTEGVVNNVRVHYLAYKNHYWTYDDRSIGRVSKAAWHLRDSYNKPMAAAVAEIVGRERPDVVHTNNIVGISVAAWDAIDAIGIPIVHTLRDYYLMCPKSTMFTNGSNCERPCAGCSVFARPRKAASRKVSAVVGVSRFIVEKHRQNGYFPLAKSVTAIHTGFDVKPSTAPRREPEPGKLIIGFLGSLSPNKGIDRLLRAVAMLPADRVTCLVAGVGRPDYEWELRTKHDRSNVRFLGSSAAAEFLRSIDLLVVPSLWEEPLARVLIESISLGTPVVTTPRGGLPEVVRDGFDGIITNGDSVEAIRDAIEGLLRDPDRLAALKSNVSAGREAKSIRAMAEEYEQVYDEIRPGLAARPRSQPLYTS